MGLRVVGCPVSGFWDLGFRVWEIYSLVRLSKGLGFRVEGLAFWGLRVWGFRVWGLGFGVWGFRASKEPLKEP